MAIKNFFKVLVGSILYPFMNLPSLIVPYLMTLLLYVALGYVGLQMNLQALAKGGFEFFGKEVLLDLLLIFVMLLAVMPLFVAIIRNVVQSEKIDMWLLKNIVGGRELKSLFTWLKLIIVYLVPLVLAGFALVTMGDKVSVAVPDFGLNLGMQLGDVVLVIGFLISLWLLARASMAPVTAALDKSISIRNSFKVTKGHGGFIFLTLVSLIGLMSLLIGLILHYTGNLGVVVDVNALLAMPGREELVLIAEIVAVRLLIAIIVVAALSKIFVAIGTRG